MLRLSLVSSLVFLSACGGTASNATFAGSDAAAPADAGATSFGYRDARVIDPSPPPDGGQQPFDGGMMMPPPNMDHGDAGPPQFSDGGNFQSPVTTNQAFCGMNSCATPADKCCLQMNGGPMCVAATAAVDQCLVVIACDGPEDCPQGQHCCITPNSTGGAVTACATACMAGHSLTLCHRASDCAAEAPDCCKGSADSAFGSCTTAMMAPAGAECDVP
jgi:hypothetical protein